MPNSSLPLTLHSTTATNSDATTLKGLTVVPGGHNAIILWFGPLSSYDGTVNYEYSPNGGTDWYAIEARDVAAIGTATTTFATPTTTASRIVVLPAGVVFRTRLSGGTQGTLSVYGRLTYRTI